MRQAGRIHMATDNVSKADNRAGKPDTGQAFAMLTLFSSVGARAFDVTLTDIEGKKIETPEGFKPNRSLEELRRTIGRTMQEATHRQHNIIIRPRSATAALIQLDDLDADKAARIAPHAFMLLCTSPQNHQAWVAVKDAPADKDQAKDFARRLRKGAEADPTATGATRISGSLNFKTKYAPAFPIVQITHAQAGKVTTAAELENAGLVAAREEPQPPASVPPQISRPSQKLPGERRWPDYQQALRGAPRKPDGSPDRSLADFMWSKWAVERGWSIEATAEKLAEVSPKAQERNRVKEDKGYALLTARNAARAVEQDRGRQRPRSQPAARREI